jgi:hypothetical protein
MTRRSVAREEIMHRKLYIGLASLQLIGVVALRSLAEMKKYQWRKRIM